MNIDFQFNSSVLSNASYNTDANELTVTFTNGKVYVYVDVDRSTWDSLISARSAGAYFNSIKKELKQK